jgi:hypothetical protein
VSRVEEREKGWHRERKMYLISSVSQSIIPPAHSIVPLAIKITDQPR